MIGVEFVVGKNYEVLVKGARFEVPMIAILACSQCSLVSPEMGGYFRCN